MLTRSKKDKVCPVRRLSERNTMNQKQTIYGRGRERPFLTPPSFDWVNSRSFSDRRHTARPLSFFVASHEIQRPLYVWMSVLHVDVFYLLLQSGHSGIKRTLYFVRRIDPAAAKAEIKQKHKQLCSEFELLK